MTRPIRDGNTLADLLPVMAGLRAIVNGRARGDQMGTITVRTPEIVPLQGSDEAKLRALAADLVRRKGGEQASRLGDIFVAAIQEERRK